MTDSMNGLPKELIEQLGGQVRKARPYNGHDLVLSYIAAHDGATANDLLIYLFKAAEKVTTRGYLYHITRRLRERGQIETRDSSIPHKAKHYITEAGRKAARPYWEVSQ